MWEIYLALAVVAVTGLVYFLPRLSAFLIGPSVLIAAAVFFIKLKKLFFFFHSDGSAAGLFIPFFMWLVLIIACFLGVALIGGGLKRIKEEESEALEKTGKPQMEPPSLPDLPEPAALALKEGRIIDVTKILLAHHPELTIAEGKAVIENYFSENPGIRAAYDAKTASSKYVLMDIAGGIAFFVIIALLVVFS